MTQEHAAATPRRLTSGQRTRIEFARRDWEEARAEDLSQMDPASLILLIERMRGRLEDVLDLVAELTSE
ncbi:hypothetical protein ACFXKY_08190 [Streptomyces canus]|uniref:hypothetical protein n=1 Tax=Streptomyces canus TaxID=58343 RepID=UPI0036BC74C2